MQSDPFNIKRTHAGTLRNAMIHSTVKNLMDIVKTISKDTKHGKIQQGKNQ